MERRSRSPILDDNNTFHPFFKIIHINCTILNIFTDFLLFIKKAVVLCILHKNKRCFMDLSLVDALQLFYLDRESYVSDASLRDYERILQYFVKYLEEVRGCPASEIAVSSITVDDVRLYQLSMRNKRKNEGHPFKPVSDTGISKSSIRTYMVHLKAFLNFCINEEYCDAKVLKNFKMIKAEKKVKLPLSAEEVEEIDSCFNVNTFCGLRNCIIFHLMLDCGFRVKDVINLKNNASSIDFDKKIIVVYDGKGSKDRMLPFPLKLRKMIMTYQLLYKDFLSDSDYLFIKSGSERIPLTASAVKMVFSRVKSKTGIMRLHPHLLRHTFATSYLLDGGSIYTLMLYMGHESIETTEGYLHVTEVLRNNLTNYYHLDDVYFRRLKNECN